MIKFASIIQWFCFVFLSVNCKSGTTIGVVDVAVGEVEAVEAAGAGPGVVDRAIGPSTEAAASAAEAEVAMAAGAVAAAVMAAGASEAAAEAATTSVVVSARTTNLAVTSVKYAGIR